MPVSVLSESLSEVAAAELVQRLEVLERRVAGLPPAAAARALRIVDRVERSDKVAYNFTNAAAVLDISYKTLWREVARGYLHPMEGLKLISRDELLRWARERTRTVSPRARSPISEQPPIEP